MRLPTAWAKVAHSNSILKILTISFGLIAVLTSTISIAVVYKPPLVIERSCGTEVRSIVGKEPTDEEIKDFTIDALKARFNSDGGNLHLLSLDETKKRSLEQEQFSKQNIIQSIILKKENIIIEEDTIYVNSDRHLAVDDLRPGFVFKLKIKFAKTKRSQLNQYGLVITKIEEIKPKKEEE